MLSTDERGRGDGENRARADAAEGAWVSEVGGKRLLEDGHDLRKLSLGDLAVGDRLARAAERCRAEARGVEHLPDCAQVPMKDVTIRALASEDVGPSLNTRTGARRAAIASLKEEYLEVALADPTR